MAMQFRHSVVTNEWPDDTDVADVSAWIVATLTAAATSPVFCRSAEHDQS